MRAHEEILNVKSFDLSPVDLVDLLLAMSAGVAESACDNIKLITACHPATLPQGVSASPISVVYLVLENHGAGFTIIERLRDSGIALLRAIPMAFRYAVRHCQQGEDLLAEEEQCEHMKRYST